MLVLAGMAKAVAEQRTGFDLSTPLPKARRPADPRGIDLLEIVAEGACFRHEADFGSLLAMYKRASAHPYEARTRCLLIPDRALSAESSRLRRA